MIFLLRLSLNTTPNLMGVIIFIGNLLFLETLFHLDSLKVILSNLSEHSSDIFVGFSDFINTLITMFSRVSRV